jgi:hypothetical protein
LAFLVFFFFFGYYCCLSPVLGASVLNKAHTCIGEKQTDLWQVNSLEPLSEGQRAGLREGAQRESRPLPFQPSVPLLELMTFLSIYGHSKVMCFTKQRRKNHRQQYSTHARDREYVLMSCGVLELLLFW